MALAVTAPAHWAGAGSPRLRAERAQGEAPASVPVSTASTIGHTVKGRCEEGSTDLNLLA